VLKEVLPNTVGGEDALRARPGYAERERQIELAREEVRAA
jgi:hypothetical protein